jgi:hypothetical protein
VYLEITIYADKTCMLGWLRGIRPAAPLLFKSEAECREYAATHFPDFQIARVITWVTL